MKPNKKKQVTRLGQVANTGFFIGLTVWWIGSQNDSGGLVFLGIGIQLIVLVMKIIDTAANRK